MKLLHCLAYIAWYYTIYNELNYCWLTRTKNKLVCSPRDQDELLLRHFRVFPHASTEQVNKLLQQHLSHFEGFARGQCRKPQPDREPGHGRVDVWVWLWGLHTLAERNNRKFSNARKHLLFVQLVEFMRVKQRLTIAA